MKTLARAVYLVFGTLAIGLGILALLAPSLALPPDDARPTALHLVREQGAEGVFIGLMALWCATHLEQRRWAHAALLVFAALFSAIHWAEYLRGARHLASPLANSMPLLALLVVTPFPRTRKPTGSGGRPPAP